MDTIQKSDYPNDLKLQAICYAILGVAGEKNFGDMMTYLGAYTSTNPTPEAAAPPRPAGNPDPSAQPDPPVAPAG